MSDKTLYCSFCGKSQHEIQKLIAGPKVYICNECVMLCVDIIEDKQGFEKSVKVGEAQHKTLMEMMKPPDKGYLDHLKGIVDGFTGKAS